MSQVTDFHYSVDPDSYEKMIEKIESRDMAIGPAGTGGFSELRWRDRKVKAVEGAPTLEEMIKFCNTFGVRGSSS